MFWTTFTGSAKSIAQYNLKWNFFNGTTEAELNAQMSKDKVWERETRDFRDQKRAWAGLGIEDPIKVWVKMPPKPRQSHHRQPPLAAHRASRGRDLEAKDGWSAEVRKAYKALIKCRI